MYNDRHTWIKIFSETKLPSHPHNPILTTQSRKSPNLRQPMPQAHSHMASISDPNPKIEYWRQSVKRELPPPIIEKFTRKFRPVHGYMGTELIKPIAHQQISNNTVRNMTKFKYLTLLKSKKEKSSTHTPI